MLVEAVAPALRKRGDDDTMRLIARRFGLGSIAAPALATSFSQYFAASKMRAFADAGGVGLLFAPPTRLERSKFAGGRQSQKPTQIYHRLTHR